MSDLLQDLKFGWRSLRKNPGFTGIALATLAIGIGANTAIFSFVNGVMLRPLPYAEPQRIVRVLEKPPGGDYNGISTLNYLDWERDNRCFEYMAAETGGSVTLSGSDDPVQLRGLRVTARYFDIYGVRPALGRTFVPGDDEPGRNHIAVISHSLWQSQFGGDRSVVGRTVQLDGQPHTVIGVLPADSAFNRSWPQIWRPLAFTPANRTRDFHWFGAMAKLKPGITLDQARAQMTAIGERIARDYPDSNRGWGVAVDLLQEINVSKELRQSLYVLLSAVGMVLLIGCANLANLMLARGIARDREVAIRAALGATRGRLVRQLLTESVLLSVVGGILGLVVGYGAMAGLKLALPPFLLPSEARVEMDGGVLLFTLILAVLTGIACGLFPALQASRQDLTTGMKQAGGGASAGPVRHRMRTALVVAEVALAFVLLAGAGLLLRSLARLQQVDTGFNASNVLTAEVPIPQRLSKEAAPLLAYLRQMQDSIAALPGVRDVAFTSALPMRGWGYGMAFQIAGKPNVDRAKRPSCFFKMVSPGYFRAIGLPVIRGRALNGHDREGSAPVTVINQAMQKKYFADQNPIGQRVLIQEIKYGKTELGPEIPWEIVGVVADEKVGSLSDREEPSGVYIALEQSATTYLGLVVHTASDPALLHQPLRAAVHRLNPNQALPEMKSLDQIKNESLGSNRLNTLLLGLFAGVALLLAALGLYGVISYTVVQRTREIGIRSALGATPRHIVQLILRHGMLAVAAGLVFGGVAILALARLFSSMLFGVSGHDPVTLCAVAVILSVIGLLACCVPARRALAVGPLDALRSE